MPDGDPVVEQDGPRTWDDQGRPVDLTAQQQGDLRTWDDRGNPAGPGSAEQGQDDLRTWDDRGNPVSPDRDDVPAERETEDAPADQAPGSDDLPSEREDTDAPPDAHQDGAHQDGVDPTSSPDLRPDDQPSGGSGVPRPESLAGLRVDDDVDLLDAATLDRTVALDALARGDGPG